MCVLQTVNFLVSLVHITHIPVHMHAVAVNEAGDTPLSLECSRGNLDMVKALINKLVDPNSKCFISAVTLLMLVFCMQSQSTRLVTPHSLWPVPIAALTQLSTL